MKMIIGIYSPSVNHFIETLIYWLSLDKTFKIILITQTDSKSFPICSEHPWCIKRIQSFNNITIISPNEALQNLDYLYISFERNFQNSCT